jgi:hypothetical protein
MGKDFLYNIKAKVDTGSFEKGRQELEKLKASGVKLAKGLAATGVAIAGVATKAGALGQQELAVARAVGVSSASLDKWKISAAVAGTNAGALTSSLASLETKMQHLKTGSIDSALSKNLGMMGIGYGDFAKMDSEQRMRSVFGAADRMKDQKLAATLVSDILGSAGRQYYESLKMSGKTLEQSLAEAKALNYMTDDSRKKAAAFYSDTKSIWAAGKSIAQLLGSEIAGELTPIAQKIKAYLITNQAQIRKGITGIAKTTGAVFKGVAGLIEKVGPVVEKLVDKFGGLSRVIEVVGVGFATLKISQLVGGLASMAKGINLVQAAVQGIGKGIMMGGLFLLLDDIFGYFMGKDSMLGYVLNNLDKIQAKIKNIMPPGAYDAMVESVNKLTTAFNNLDKAPIKEALKKIADVTFTSFMRELQRAIDGMTTLIEFANAIQTGGLEGGWTYIQDKRAEKKAKKEQFYAQLDSSGLSAEDIATIKREYAVRNASLVGGLFSFGADMARAFNTGTALPEMTWDELEDMISSGYKWDGENFVPFQTYSLEANPSTRIKGTYSHSLEDGIISPDGRVTSVSPDDWVFAAKNVEDLAAAFVPWQGMQGAAQAGNATFNINQTFSFQGGMGGLSAETIQSQAYKGTAAALQDNLTRASRYIQLMPGTM